MAALSLSPQVFAILSAVIEERSGLHYALADRELLAEKVAPRALEAGFESLLDYYYFLRYDPRGEQELQALVETLVVHETYFFREFEQLRTAVDEIVAPRVKAAGRARVWSAACATGEEPLTLAMLLEERGLRDKVDVLATDVSARAIERAQAGTFSRRSVRQVPEPTLARRFLDISDSGVEVQAQLRRSIDWRTLNLLDAAGIAKLAPFDLILCRNVLIYFRDEVARAVVGSLSSQLQPGGALLVGVSESLLRFGSSLSCEELRGVFFYRRPR